MTWPLEPRGGARASPTASSKILVVEEKRGADREPAQGAALRPRATRRAIIGKRDERGAIAVPSRRRARPATRSPIAIGRAHPRARPQTTQLAAQRRATQRARASRVAETPAMPTRTPYFCSGCPHNTSTKVPEGSRALAGIGCHYMAQWMDRNTAGFTQMGGEGATWIGQAPFTKTHARLPEPRRRHLLPFRPPGDPRRGRRRRQHHLQDPLQRRGRDDRRPAGRRPADGAADHPPARGRGRRAHRRRHRRAGEVPRRRRLRARRARCATATSSTRVQRELREIAGRHGHHLRPDLRRREAPPAQARPYARSAQARLHQRAGLRGLRRLRRRSPTASSVVPVETEFGRKRAIDQSTCNKDYSCLKGFCPSFVTVEGGELAQGAARRRRGARPMLPALPEPALPDARRAATASWSPASAAPASSPSARCSAWPRTSRARAAAVLDMTGLAQKGGAVMQPCPHRRRARTTSTPCASRAGGARPAARLRPRRRRRPRGAGDAARRAAPRVVVNTHADDDRRLHPQPRSRSFPAAALERRHRRGAPARERSTSSTPRGSRPRCSAIRSRTNLFMLGFAWQKGLMPLSARRDRAGDRAQRRRGRRRTGAPSAGAAARRSIRRAVEAAAARRAGERSRSRPRPLDEVIARRVAFLTDYQDAAYAAALPRRWSSACARPRRSGRPGRTGLAEAVARYYFKLMAYKDEYEVARLYTERRLPRQAQPPVRGRLAKLQLPSGAAARSRRRDPATGELEQARATAPGC